MTQELLVQIILGGLGTTGVVGAVVALYKLRPDLNSAAVTQSQGAMETMRGLNEELTQDRDYWRKRAVDAEKQVRSCADDVRRLTAQVERLQAARHPRPE